VIIKNEGPILPRLFESVRVFVSEYCVVDTGSTDDTINILKSMEMSGIVLEEPFVDFATTRNYMIEKCRQVMTSCDYSVLLDADMVLRVSPEWDWTDLDGQDVYNFIQMSGVEYENVRMIRRDAQDIPRRQGHPRILRCSLGLFAENIAKGADPHRRRG
jgi:glycosyltransferase involved in cell wall biosynthesis